MAFKVLAITALAATVALLAIYGTGSLTQRSNSVFLAAPNKQVEQFVNEAFLQWAIENDKVYSSYNEQAYRLQVFESNLLFIQNHKNEQHSYKLGLNKFADLTAEEFRARYLSLKVELKDSYNPNYLDVNDLPASVDWRDNGIVAPVKDQGQCGSCWAFSAVAAIEGLYAQDKGTIQTFSEQQLVDCSGSQGNQGCNGGLMDSAFKYVKQHGLQTDGQYAYNARDGHCQESKFPPTFTLTGYGDVPAGDNDQLAAAVAQRVVSVAIEADTEVFQFYESGIIDSASCGTQLDHGVAAVGYATDNSGKDYWIVRNSWGASWGNNGYVNILKQKGRGSGICGIAKMASYPTK